MGNDVIGKIFERGSFANVNHGFEDRGFFRGSINPRRRRRRQANVRSRFLHYIRDEVIAAQHPSRWIQEHQVGCAIRESERREHLQRQREARLGKNRARSPLRANRRRRNPSRPTRSRTLLHDSKSREWRIHSMSVSTPEPVLRLVKT